MPWTRKEYPDAMKNLPFAIRNKAVEISNAILEEGKLDEGQTIAIGISQAKKWGENHGKRIRPLKNNR